MNTQATEAPAAMDATDRLLFANLLGKEMSVPPSADGSHWETITHRFEALTPTEREAMRSALAPALRAARARFDAMEQAHAEAERTAEVNRRRSIEAAKWQRFSDAGNAHVAAVREYEAAARALDSKAERVKLTVVALRDANPVPLTLDIPQALTFNALRYPGESARDGISAAAAAALKTALEQHQWPSA